MAGSGMGLMMMPLNSHLMNKAPRELVSRVTSLTSALQQVVNSLAVAAVVTILTAHLNSLAADHPPGAEASEADIAQAMLALAPQAFDYTFKVMFTVAACGIALGFLLRRGKKPGGEAAPGPAPERAMEGAHMG